MACRGKDRARILAAMDAEKARKYLLQLPHVVETMQWGANIVFWVGDKAIGGKMFALMNLDEDVDPLKPAPVLSFYAGPEPYSGLLENEEMMPAPYMARIYWVALRNWRGLRETELKDLLAAAHAGVLGKLPKRTRAVLAMSVRERNKLIAERRKLLAERSAETEKQLL